MLESFAHDVGVDGAVRFLGARADARRILPAFDVYANSSISEGVSLTILEAMAAGLPVVATRVGGTSEVIENGATGVLVPARYPARLADALLALSWSGEYRRGLGSAARRSVEVRFALENRLRMGLFAVSIAVIRVTRQDYADVALLDQADDCLTFRVARHPERPVHYRIHEPVTLEWRPLPPASG